MINFENINLINFISLAEDSLRGLFEDKLSAKDAVFQAHNKAAAREGKNIFDEPFTTEEEAAEQSLLDFALEAAISGNSISREEYRNFIKNNHIEYHQEDELDFRKMKNSVNEIITCLQIPRFIDRKKDMLGEEAVELLKYITTGGINHKAPAFVIG